MRMFHRARNALALTAAGVLTVGLSAAPASANIITTATPPASVDEIVGDVVDDADPGVETEYNEGTGGTLRLGTSGSAFSPGINRTTGNGVLGFTLPTLPGDITKVELSFQITQIQKDPGSLQAYLMDTTNPVSDIPAGIDNSNPDDPVDWFFNGSNDTRGGVTLVDSVAQGNVPSVGNFLTLELTGTALSEFQSMYTGNTPDQSEVFFRLNSEATLDDTDRYRVRGGPDGNGDNAASLAITAIPEPASLALLGLGGVMLLPRRHRA